MLGIGSKLDKLARQKVIAQRARQYNSKYDQLTGTGIHPDDAVKTLSHQQFEKRHQQKPQPQPYNISKNINALGGTVNQGYFQGHKINSTTKTMYQPMKEKMAKSKETKPDVEELQKAKQQFQRMKVRIHKDHLHDDADVNYGQNFVSDYKRHFVEDDNLKKQVVRDKRYNQWQNDLKTYAQAYLKSKQVLRKC